MASPKSRKTTIYTLSEEAGVSPSTVSRALSNAPGISAEVRERIQHLARKNSFRPRVVTSRAPNICALIQQYPVNMNSYLLFVIEGIAEYCQEENLEMSLFAANIEEFNRVDIVREFRRRNADGAIILQSSRETRFMQALNAANFPYYSVLNNPPNQRGARLLTVDNHKVAVTAMQYLLKLGHRRIAALSNHLVVPTGQDRLEGYLRTLKKAGIKPDEQLIQVCNPGENGLEFGFESVRSLLKERPDITAIFSFAHNMAIGAMRACHELGVRIPQDVSLLTCDDFPMTQFLCPALTAIPIPYHQLGYQAARQVHRMIRNLPELPNDSVVEQVGEMVVRESTAPPRSAGNLRLPKKKVI